GRGSIRIDTERMSIRLRFHRMGAKPLRPLRSLVRRKLKDDDAARCRMPEELSHVVDRSLGLDVLEDDVAVDERKVACNRVEVDVRVLLVLNTRAVSIQLPRQPNHRRRYVDSDDLVEQISE